MFVVWLNILTWEVFYIGHVTPQMFYFGHVTPPKCALLVMWPKKVYCMANIERVARLIHPRNILYMVLFEGLTYMYWW